MRIYKFNIRDLQDKDYELYRTHMTQSRRERLDRLKFSDDRKRSLCGYMLVVKALSELTGTPKDSIAISYDENGKPYSESTNLNFSISHSDEYAVCVVGENKVGVDIEKIRPVNMQSVRKFASENEIKYIFGHLPEKEDYVSESEEALKRFFEVWTKKEAYGKLLGVGLGYDMKNTETEKTDTVFFDGYAMSVCEE